MQVKGERREVTLTTVSNFGWRSVHAVRRLGNKRRCLIHLIISTLPRAVLVAELDN